MNYRPIINTEVAQTAFLLSTILYTIH